MNFSNIEKELFASFPNDPEKEMNQIENDFFSLSDNNGKYNALLFINITSNIYSTIKKTLFKRIKL